jgi:hypothetical protein
VLTLLESVTVVQLDSPTLFSFSTLGVMCARGLAIASCVYLSDSAAESELRLEVFRKRRAIEIFFNFFNHLIRFLQVIQSCTVEIALATKPEFAATKSIFANAVANTSA